RGGSSLPCRKSARRPHPHAHRTLGRIRPEGRGGENARRSRVHRGGPAMSFVEFTGTARLDKRTKRLVRRLGPDDIAIIDHRDLDRVSGGEPLPTNVRVVINCAPSMSGRFPNAGPLELVRGGVRLIDVNGDSDLFEEVRDGESLVVRGAGLFRNGSRLAAGHTL